MERLRNPAQLSRIPQELHAGYGPADAGYGPPSQVTSTLLNCQGSVSSRVSGNSTPRPNERRPIRVLADHRPQIGPLDRKATAEVHLVGFDDAGVGIFQHPHDAGENRGGHLQAGGVLVGGEPPRLLDRKLRAVPIGVLGVPIEQHAELVDAVQDVVLGQDVLARLRPPLARLPSRAARAPRRCRGDRRSGRSAGTAPCRPRAA